MFDAVVAIGEVEAQHIEAEDVSERFVDLESRQATLATSIDRIRGFLAQTTNVDEISRLESELTNREAEHDVIAGQLRVPRRGQWGQCVGLTRPTTMPRIASTGTRPW